MRFRNHHDIEILCQFLTCDIEHLNIVIHHRKDVSQVAIQDFGIQSLDVSSLTVTRGQSEWRVDFEMYKGKQAKVFQHCEKRLGGTDIEKGIFY